jgi:peptide/nickel transport system permease protein
VGGISGYFGGTVDLIIQRVIEFLRSIPTLPLWMALSVALPPSWSMIERYMGIIAILSLVGWTGLARVVRSKFMSLREEEYVMAGKINGSNEMRLIFKHMLPSFYSHIIASLTLSVPDMILGETALSFIGLGLQEPAISWGVLLKDAQHIRVLANAPWLLVPGLFIAVTILCFNFVGDGLRDAADPYVNI